MSVIARDATPDDLAAIMGIERSVFPADAWPEELMAVELGAAHSRYLVATDGGAVVAYAGLRVVGDQGDIQTIAVAPSHRRQGIARALLLELLVEAGRRRAREVFLEVRADNPGAIALYEALGFEHLAVRPGYYPPLVPGGAPIDALVMRLDVRRVRPPRARRHGALATDEQVRGGRGVASAPLRRGDGGP